MTMQQKELYNVIERLPEELLVKVREYIEYLEFSNTTNKAPNELIVKDKNDLIEKLQAGMNDFNDGNVCSLESAYLEAKEILAN